MADTSTPKLQEVALIILPLYLHHDSTEIGKSYSKLHTAIEVNHAPQTELP